MWRGRPHDNRFDSARAEIPTIEQLYRTHWISGELSEKKRERLAEKASRAPELVVIQPLNETWKCHRCGGTGDLLMMENPGPACLRCAGLDDLEFLGAGDALLTRRVRAKSPRHAVVVRFSRSRRRYERQGLLVEPQALTEAQRELATRARLDTPISAGPRSASSSRPGAGQGVDAFGPATFKVPGQSACLIGSSDRPPELPTRVQ